MEKRKRAEIAGAGLAGLTAAAALAQRGWDVRVHEKGSDLREIGAGIYLFENALDALADIGALADVEASGEEIRHGTLLDHLNRTVELERRSDRQPRLIVALRRDLHAALAKAATKAGAEIVTDSRVLGATGDGRLEFADGSTDQVDLVVGADGVYSRVRDSLGLAKRIVDLQDGCGRHLIERTDEDPVNHTLEIWHGGRRLGVAPASRDKVYLFLCCPAGDIRGRAQQPFEPTAWLESHPWYRSQFARIPRHPEGQWLPFYNVRCRAWSTGRVALIGDAAHAMAPNLGQGACVAMTNGVALANAVSAHADVATALRAWEAHERPMVDLTQRNSYLYGVVGTRWPAGESLLTLRSKVLPVVSRSPRFQRSIRSAVDHVPPVFQTEVGAAA
jgi:2-polyprenyl-6-methoxyphenol hydroxylase-like FAD-dependent oxidoreductase